jgi:hypothetical protein
MSRAHVRRIPSTSPNRAERADIDPFPKSLVDATDSPGQAPLAQCCSAFMATLYTE